MIPDPTHIFRVTHVDNLQGILQHGGIYAPNMTPQDDVIYKVIHHQHIQSRRSNAPVPCGPCGTVHDYVPFYFAERAPMVYAILKGNVDEYTEGQEPLIYLISTVQSVVASGTGFVFTDGHAAMAPLTEFFDDVSKLDRVDWGVMRSRWWNDTPQAPDRCRRRQAEFMIYHFCPWPLIRWIAVKTEAMKLQVEAILAGFPGSSHPIVRVQPRWYY